MPNYSNFIFVRHGQTDWNALGQFQGRTDVPLNSIGIEQAKRASRTLLNRNIDLVVSSPLQRALKTAQIIAGDLGSEIEIDDLLIECDFGSLEGRSIRSEMDKHGVTELEQLKTILADDGEHWSDILMRSSQLLAGRFSKNARKKIVFVGHDAVLQSISEQLCGHWFKSRNAVPYLFQKRQAQWECSEVR